MATYSRGRTGTNWRTGATEKQSPYHSPQSHSGQWAPGYATWYRNFEQKLNSYRTLYNQTRGPAKYTRPTPATLNTFASWINKGNIIQICTPNQVAKWARTTKMNFNTRTGSPTTCKNVLYKKFGKSAIKAVARTKTGSYMVVTTPTWKGKPFCFPK